MSVKPRWVGPRRIAHRGGGRFAPENTLAAIRAGIARGYRAVEFDVMLTADDVPVLMHDPDFGRTISGHGAVATTSFADLAARDAGAWFDPRFAGERVPRYADAVALCRAHDVWMNVEVKPSPGVEERTGRIVGAVTASLSVAEDRILFSSFSRDALAAAHAAAPRVPCGWLVEDVDARAVDDARALDCIGIHADHRCLDRATVETLHAAGFAVLAWTVNDVSEARALDAAGADALFTDRLDLLPFA